MLEPGSLSNRSVAILSYSAPPVVGGVETLVGAQARWLERYGASVKVLAGGRHRFDREISPQLTKA